MQKLMARGLKLLAAKWNDLCLSSLKTTQVLLSFPKEIRVYLLFPHRILPGSCLIRLVSLAALAAVSIPCGQASEAQSFHVGAHRFAPRNFGFVSLSVTNSPASVSFTLTPGGTAAASGTIAITTTWVGGLGFSGSLILYGYFSSATSALSGGTPVSNIPSSAVFGQVPTGTPTSFTAFTQTTPYSGASGLQLYSVTSVAVLAGSRTDNLSLKINLSSIPQLPAATYTGVLYLEAQSF